MPDLAALVPSLLLANEHVLTAELGGSRAAGTANAYSDWDFSVRTDDFAGLAPRLPELVAPLDPVVQQWDRLSEHACYMFLLDGPTKVDLIFSAVPHEPLPPWTVDAATLPAIDDHLWDWVLWLTSKVAAGRTGLVDAELTKMHEHLLGPLGVGTPPRSLGEAVDRYERAREGWARRLAVPVGRPLEAQIRRVVRSLDSESPFT